jgi:hypothetical protein
MIKEIEIVLLPEHSADEKNIHESACKALNIDIERVKSVQILKRSIDARGRKVVFRLKVNIFIDEVPKPEIIADLDHNVSDKKPVLIIGAGPAGLFAALRCIELGLKPVIIREVRMLSSEGET